MSKKMLLVSGPIKCGKQTLLDVTLPWGHIGLGVNLYIQEAACKVHLYKLVQDFFLISELRFWEIYLDRELKEKPMPEFTVALPLAEANLMEKAFGFRLDLDKFLITDNRVVVKFSVRQAMVYISELVMKPLFGRDFFGRARMRQIEDTTIRLNKVWAEPNCVFYDDSSASFNGRSDELTGLVDYFGEDNILLINIRGRGKFGVGDSRNYHADGTVKHTVDLWNTGTEKEFLDKGCKIIQDFLNRGS